MSLPRLLRDRGLMETSDCPQAGGVIYSRRHLLAGIDVAVPADGLPEEHEGQSDAGRAQCVRGRAGKTQAQFADTYRLPIGTARDREQGLSQPDTPARVLLSAIAAEPEMSADIIEAQGGHRSNRCADPSKSSAPVRGRGRKGGNAEVNWSGKEDSNLRPLPPEDNAYSPKARISAVSRRHQRANRAHFCRVGG
jgi:hypothetical protein